MEGNTFHRNKNPQTAWSDFQAMRTEPKIHNNYDVTPELEEELLEHGLFLKQRVWRNMRKVKRQNSYIRQPRHFGVIGTHHLHRSRHHHLAHF